MSTEISEDDVLDAVEAWHLDYQGDLELDEYMQAKLHWTDMEYEYWAVTGKLPGGEGNG